MAVPEVNENEIDEVISFLRSKGHSSFANRVLALKTIEALGRKQYQAGVAAIIEVEMALTEKVPRNLVLNKIASIVSKIKEVL